MKFELLTVGRLREKAWRALADDYAGRIRRWVRLDECEVKDDAELARRWPKESLVVVLEVDGLRPTSTELSQYLERWGRTGKGDVTFVIGGANGIPEALSRRAQFRLSLSSLTLPHRMAKVLLLEQLYRGLSLLRGEPYARED